MCSCRVWHLSSHQAERWRHVVGPIGAVTAHADVCCHLSAAGPCPPRVPVQAQLTYTHLDGSRRMRVLSAWRRVDAERPAAEESVHVAVVGLAAVQR